MEKKEVIRHSDIYLGETFDDGLRHWKYIRKEKKNGYTRYYYKDDEYDKAEKEYEDAITKEYQKIFKVGQTTNEYNAYEEKAKADGYYTPEEHKESGRLYQKELDAHKEYRTAVKRAEIAEKNYRKVKIKSLPRRTIGKGVAAVADAISLLAGKIKKKFKD